MSVRHRRLVQVAVLGLAIALAVVLLVRDNDPPAEFVESALAPGDDAVAEVQRLSVGAGALEPTADTLFPAAPTDESDSVCTQVRKELLEFAKAEHPASDPFQFLGLTEDELLAEWERLPRQLTDSPDPERFLTGVLLNPPEHRVSEDPSASATLLELGLRATESGSPLLAWHALRACVFADEYCPIAHLEQDLLEADRDNAETWALAATLRYRRGDVAGALAAMQEAASASTSTWYWTETAAMAERTLAEQWPAAYPALVGSGLIASSSLPNASSYRMCEDESPASRTWAEACLAFATLRAESNETVMARGLAYSMRVRSLEALGETQAADEVAREYSLFGLDRKLGMIGVWQALMVSDPDRFNAYLSLAGEHGESEGLRLFLRQELPLLMQRAGLLARDEAKECAAQMFGIPAAIEARSETFRDYPIESYPVQPGDQLHVSVNNSSRLQQIGADSVIAMQRAPAIAVVGKTTGQIEQEIEATLIAQGREPSSVHVILMSSPTPEELRREFDNALQEARAGR